MTWGCLLQLQLLLTLPLLSAEWVPVPVIGHHSDKRPPQAPPPAPVSTPVQDNHTSGDATEPAGQPHSQDEIPDEGGGLGLDDLQEAHLELLRHSREPVSGRLHFLQQLHDRLLGHVAALLPETVRSFARSGEDADLESPSEGRGHKGIGFPSHEGTLLSLCFLVFAVFLVKVVLQLVHAVQNSQFTTGGTAGVRVAQMPDGMLPGTMTMMNMVPAMMPPMMAAGAADAGAGSSRSQRGARSVHDHPSMERTAQTVIEAIRKAHAKFAWIEWDSP